MYFFFFIISHRLCPYNCTLVRLLDFPPFSSTSLTYLSNSRFNLSTMRIRKRFPPPSTASSDLHLSQSAATQPKSEAPRQPSDKVMATSCDVDSNTRWALLPQDDINNYGEKMKLKESGAWRKEQKILKRATNDIRENNISYAEECTNNTFMPPSSSSSSAKGDTYKVLVPLKKRRGSFERSPKEETEMSARMKSKTNKKCDSSTQTDQDAVALNINHGSTGAGAKKSKRGNVIMEGSRCSRVNGRGWRCCQPTLVGYALCEHHLGKGRVRSMTSVSQRHEVDHSGGARPLNSTRELGLQQPSMVTKRRTKVGVVKARSISSLLSQV